MVNVKQQIRSAAEKRGILKHGALISSCVMIVFAVVMFALAMFAPFKYYSARDVLHILHVEDEDKSGFQEDVYVAQNIAVHQSMFRVFSAAEALGDASVLHAFYTDGVMPKDTERLMSAREHLDKLRKQYADIYSTTAREAKDNGISTDSEQFAEVLAKRLAQMNLMALDLLETATTADKPTSYSAMFSACVLGMFSAIFNILICVLSIVALIFAVLNLVTKRAAVETPVILRLFTILTAVSLFLLLFNTAMPPASGPLALCCAAVAVFFLFGAARSVLAADGSGSAVIRNMAVAALSGVGMLVLAATPSYIMYLNGLGGWHLYYPGTVGTVYFSWVEAMSKVGLEIPHGAITVSRILGIIVSIVSVVCADKALIRLYRNSQDKSVLSSVAMFISCAVSIALCIISAALTSKLQSAGTLVKFIAGASWYASAALMFVGGLFGLLFGLKNVGGSAPQSGIAEAKAETDGVEPAADSDVIDK